MKICTCSLKPRDPSRIDWSSTSMECVPSLVVPSLALPTMKLLKEVEEGRRRRGEVERLRHHLHNTLTGKQVLLVGCGGTTSDPHFTELFQTLEKINPHGMPRHIPLCTDKDYEQFNTQIPASTAVALRVTRQIHLCALAALLHSSSRGVAWAGRPRNHQNRIWPFSVLIGPPTIGV